MVFPWFSTPAFASFRTFFFNCAFFLQQRLAGQSVSLEGRREERFSCLASPGFRLLHSSCSCYALFFPFFFFCSSSMPPSFRFFHQMICYHILLRVLFFYSLPTVGIVRAPPGQHSVRRREEGVSHVVTRGFPLVLSSSVYFCTVFFSFFPYSTVFFCSLFRLLLAFMCFPFFSFSISSFFLSFVSLLHFFRSYIIAFVISFILFFSVCFYLQHVTT